MSAREVELTGGAPWGFRMHGGADQHQPLRISRVNPGRKASLSGIREGDVISSINGRSTKGMSNADAHAMLRAAGPVLKLGLNEDREMSPRRRSIGKGSELKRPSQLLAESERATPQAPVYATVRAAPPSRSALNPLPAALNSTPLVKSVAAPEEPPKFHPTNPFYTTLPSNHSSASKLPVPNGRASYASVDRSNQRDASYLDCGSNLRSPSYYSKTSDGPSSLPYMNHSQNLNGHGSETAKSAAKEFSEPYSFSGYDRFDKQSLPSNVNSGNPFEPKRNSDPFEKYLRPDNLNGRGEDTRNIPASQRESNFHRNEKITERSTITEHKISEVEEVRTIKKIILNGSGSEKASEHQSAFSVGGNNRDFEFTSPQPPPQTKDYAFHSSEQRMFTPTKHNEYFSSSSDKKEEVRNFSSSSDSKLPSAETSTEPVASKPPVKPDFAPAPSSPSKREYLQY